MRDGQPLLIANSGCRNRARQARRYQNFQGPLTDIPLPLFERKPHPIQHPSNLVSLRKHSNNVLGSRSKYLHKPATQDGPPKYRFQRLKSQSHRESVRASVLIVGQRMPPRVHRLTHHGVFLRSIFRGITCAVSVYPRIARSRSNDHRAHPRRQRRSAPPMVSARRMARDLVTAVPPLPSSQIVNALLYHRCGDCYQLSLL